jgi:hypothetical protein
MLKRTSSDDSEQDHIAVRIDDGSHEVELYRQLRELKLENKQLREIQNKKDIKNNEAFKTDPSLIVEYQRQHSEDELFTFLTEFYMEMHKVRAYYADSIMYKLFEHMKKTSKICEFFLDNFGCYIEHLIPRELQTESICKKMIEKRIFMLCYTNARTM